MWTHSLYQTILCFPYILFYLVPILRPLWGHILSASAPAPFSDIVPFSCYSPPAGVRYSIFFLLHLPFYNLSWEMTRQRSISALTPHILTSDFSALYPIFSMLFCLYWRWSCPLFLWASKASYRFRWFLRMSCDILLPFYIAIFLSLFCPGILSMYYSQFVSKYLLFFLILTFQSYMRVSFNQLLRSFQF